jgi:hypothetical protein
MPNQKSESPFKDIPVIGEFPPDKLASKLRELGDVKAAEEIEKSSKRRGFFGKGQLPAWKHTAHAFGYIGPVQPGSTNLVPITHAGNIVPGVALKGKRINIALGALRVAEYPGGGIHNILFDFHAQNQLPNNQTEDLHFNQTYRVQQGQSAPILGYPIFIGLNVGSVGVSFQCFTVNVKNDNDQAVLNFLDSDVFKNGLKLVTTAQPAIAPLTGIAVGVTKMIASRNNNVPVQNFFMGLDFTNIPFSARLAEGAYLAVQIPQEQKVVWDWTKWAYSPQNGLVVNKDDTSALIPYNYIIFNVSRFDEP